MPTFLRRRRRGLSDGFATRVRRNELFIGCVAAGVVAWNASTACSVSSRGPSVSCTPGAQTLECLGVAVTVVADGPVTIGLQGGTPSTLQSGVVNYVGLAASTYVISGTMSGRNASFTISRMTSTVAGGPVPASIQSLKGPGASVSTDGACVVKYAATDSSPPPQDFRFQFTIATIGAVC
jgi:hypothetical protein